jgi:imidazolonepropionase-like amidohydrolase
MEALLAATRRPAELLNKTDVFGTIAPGRSADLLVLRANPLADIRNTRTIEQVIVRGHIYEPDAVLASMRQIQTA